MKKLLAALRLWLEEYLDEDPMAAGIELILDDAEGIVAAIS